MTEDFVEPSFSDDPWTSFFPVDFAFGEVFGFYQKFDHFSSPALIEFFVQVGQFALEMGVAQSVQAIFKGEIRSKAVVDQEIFKQGKQAHAFHRFATSFGIKVVAGEPVGAEDMQPMTFAVEGAAGFISVENGTGHERFANGFHGDRGLAPSVFHNIGKGARADRAVKEFGKSFAETLKGNELVAPEIEGGGLHIWAVLGRCGDSGGKGGGEFFTAAMAGAFRGAVFGDFKLDGR